MVADPFPSSSKNKDPSVFPKGDQKHIHCEKLVSPPSSKTAQSSRFATPPTTSCLATPSRTCTISRHPAHTQQLFSKTVSHFLPFACFRIVVSSSLSHQHLAITGRTRNERDRDDKTVLPLPCREKVARCKEMLQVSKQTRHALLCFSEIIVMNVLAKRRRPG